MTNEKITKTFVLNDENICLDQNDQEVISDVVDKFSPSISISDIVFSQTNDWGKSTQEATKDRLLNGVYKEEFKEIFYMMADKEIEKCIKDIIAKNEFWIPNDRMFLDGMLDYLSSSLKKEEKNDEKKERQDIEPKCDLRAYKERIYQKIKENKVPYSLKCKIGTSSIEIGAAGSVGGSTTDSTDHYPDFIFREDDKIVSSYSNAVVAKQHRFRWILDNYARNNNIKLSELVKTPLEENCIIDDKFKCLHRKFHTFLEDTRNLNNEEIISQAILPGVKGTNSAGDKCIIGLGRYCVFEFKTKNSEFRYLFDFDGNCLDSITDDEEEVMGDRLLKHLYQNSSDLYVENIKIGDVFSNKISDYFDYVDEEMELEYQNFLLKRTLAHDTFSSMELYKRMNSIPQNSRYSIMRYKNVYLFTFGDLSVVVNSKCEYYDGEKWTKLAKNAKTIIDKTIKPEDGFNIRRLAKDLDKMGLFEKKAKILLTDAENNEKNNALREMEPAPEPQIKTVDIDSYKLTTSTFEQKDFAASVLNLVQKRVPAAIIAGGAPRNWSLGQVANDIDVFVPEGVSLEHASADLCNFLGIKFKRIGKSDEVYNENPQTIKEVWESTNSKLKIQLISSKRWSENASSFAEQILNTFDFGICKVAIIAAEPGREPRWKKSQDFMSDMKNLTLTVRMTQLKRDGCIDTLPKRTEKMQSYFPNHRLVIK